MNTLDKALTENAPIESPLNLVTKSGQLLREAGITTIAELDRLGPVIADRPVKQSQPKASLDCLWATARLEGEDWRELMCPSSELSMEVEIE